VPIPAGKHSVLFEYRPASLCLGALGSLATLLAGGAWVFLGRRRSLPH